MGDSKGIIEKSDKYESDLIIISKANVFSKPLVIRIAACFLIVISGGFVSMYLSLRDITASTEEAVSQEIPGLKRQIEALEETNKDLEDVNEQAVKWIVKLADQLIAAGLTPPRIELRPGNTVP